MTNLDDLRPRLFGSVPESIIATTSFRRLPETDLAFLRAIPDATSLLADALDALGIGAVVPAADVGPLVAGRQACGQAVTLRCEAFGGAPDAHYRSGSAARAGDRDLYGLANPGDVALISTGGDRTVAALGDISQAFARLARVAGVLVDGVVRDVAALRDGGVPIWSRGASPRAARYRWSAAELNGVVTFAGARVEAGDLVVADDNGLCVVPLTKTDTVLADCRRRAQAERDVEDEVGAAASLEDLIHRLRGNAVG